MGIIKNEALILLNLFVYILTFSYRLPMVYEIVYVSPEISLHFSRSPLHWEFMWYSICFWVCCIQWFWLVLFRYLLYWMTAIHIYHRTLLHDMFVFPVHNSYTYLFFGDRHLCIFPVYTFHCRSLFNYLEKSMNQHEKCELFL